MTTNTEIPYIPDSSDCRTCNVCSSHCPTFKVNRISEESPRGRLKIISKLLIDGENLTEDEVIHLNNCVECRACEKVCPSKMRYFKLLKKAREKLPQTGPSPLVKGLLYFTSHRNSLLRLFKGLRIYQKSGLQSMAEKLGLLKITGTKKLNSMLPTLAEYRHVEKFYPAKTQRKGAVALFTGCLTNTMDNPTLHATIKVLNYLGYDVHTPQQQQCCGAVHSHNNDKGTADQLAEINLNVFKDLDVEAIVITASACGSPLKQYKRRDISEEMKAEAEKFETKIKDISQFIAEQEWPEEVELAPLNIRVAIHEPCSQQYPLASHKCAYEYLGRIPGIDLIPLPENNICCGAGGSYMLTHPENSEAIRADKLNHIRESECKIVATSNIGCALHLASGITQDKQDVLIAHPVELLAQQIVA